MLATAKSIAAGDSALGVVLGLGVVLTFAGVLLRAVATRVSPSHLGAAVTARLDAAAIPAAGAPMSTHRQEASQLEAPVPALVELAAICEPEARSLSDEGLAPLARTLDDSRRLLAAEERVAGALAELPNSFWLVERNVLVGSRRVPFLALGATGVFALSPSDGHWTLEDLAEWSDVAAQIRAQLPGYAGPVLGAVCLAFDDLAPRTWHGGEVLQGRGGWLLGLEWLLPWMFSFEPDDGACEWCDRHPDRPCPACNARRRRAVRLVEGEGLAIGDTARRMGLSAGRVERLLEEEADRRALAQFRQSHVENAALRRRFRQRQLVDPALTVSELARRVGTSPIQVERWLGLCPTARKTDRHGRTYPGRTLDAISVENAGRLARAMGYAPCEIEGC
jgi:transposase-like protein